MKILHLPDMHLGYPIVNAKLIHQHLRELVYPKLNKDLDILFIGGDFFHTSLDMNSRAAYHVNSIIIELRELAHVNDFLIRVVRGTFSHDRMQNHFFIRDEDPDSERVKVFQNLALEHIDKYDIWVLYKPDDLSYVDVWGKILELLDQQHIKQVDIFINHGYFEHLLPPNLPRKPHGILDALKVKPYVKGVTLNGHIHTPSIYENVINGGSFERFRHGEEEDKGFFIIDYNQTNGEVSYEFIKNERTPLFKTFAPKGDNVLEEFNDWLDKLDIGDAEFLNARVITHDSSLKQALTRSLLTKYPTGILQTKKEKSYLDDPESIHMDVVELPILTPNNLADKLKEHIELKLQQHIEKSDIIQILGY